MEPSKEANFSDEWHTSSHDLWKCYRLSAVFNGVRLRSDCRKCKGPIFDRVTPRWRGKTAEKLASATLRLRYDSKTPAKILNLQPELMVRRCNSIETIEGESVLEFTNRFIDVVRKLRHMGSVIEKTTLYRCNNSIRSFDREKDINFG